MVCPNEVEEIKKHTADQQVPRQETRATRHDTESMLIKAVPCCPHVLCLC